MPIIQSPFRESPTTSTQNHLTANYNCFHHKYSLKAIGSFVNQDVRYALNFALTQNVYEDPSYLNLLCSCLLVTHGIHSTDVVSLLKRQAFCVGLLQDARAITVCVRKFIDAAPADARREAFECYQPESNPAYYARICDLLSQDIISASLGADHLYMRSNDITGLLMTKLTEEQCKVYAELNYKRAYCLSLTNATKGMVNNLKTAAAIHKEHMQKLLTETHAKHTKSNVFDIELVKIGLIIPRPNETENFTHYRHDPYSPNTKKMFNLPEQGQRERVTFRF